jgi:hypothetical protein
MTGKSTAGARKSAQRMDMAVRDGERLGDRFRPLGDLKRGCPTCGVLAHYRCRMLGMPHFYAEETHPERITANG